MKQILIALDQLANAVCAGHADETLSARAWRKREVQPWKTLRPVIDGLFFFDPAHCRTSYEAERSRKHLPHVYREEQG